ncbi:MAG TPA: helix-turn-helix transcriptional regulator [Acidimicrobiales bacterium]|nr:helix-turn-helix transcriptional regulator [Acidimicrobiales bacterium]
MERSVRPEQAQPGVGECLVSDLRSGEHAETSSGDALLKDIRAIGNELVKAWLLLLVAQQPSHGYDLVEAVRTQGMSVADPSYVYRLLRELDRVGLLSSHWDHSGRGMARRVYTITRLGRAELSRYASAVALLGGRLQRYGESFEGVRLADPGN